jgi:glycosyltransferase involved in cell wall biosynthesis
MNTLPSVSVVLCSLNGGDVINGALDAITAQQWAGELEIIVVDDGSTDETFKIAESYSGIKVIKNITNKGISTSRNIGINAAKGEIIAFTDDDCRPRPTWIKELCSVYTSKRIQGVGGTFVSVDTSNFMFRYLKANQITMVLENRLFKSNNLFYRFGLYLRNISGLNKPIPNRKRSVYALVGGNMSFRKTALKAAGMFDDRFTFGGEEEDLCKRLTMNDTECLWFAPKAVVIHQLDGKLRDSLRRSTAYGVGVARMYLKHEDVKPIIYPFPIIIILSFLLGLINSWYLLTPFVLVLVIYSLGLRLFIKKARPETLLYGYIQFLQEFFGNIGFIKGWWKYRHVFNKTTSLQSNTES